MNSRYNTAKEIYKDLEIDTDEIIKKLSKVNLSIHCWQGDDIGGFENKAGVSGGIAVTGNYPYKANTPEELMADIDKMLSLVPGKNKISLHAIYAITDENVKRCDLGPTHFKAWVDFAKKRGIGLDFNPTLFSHEMVKDGLTLSHPDKEVRDFWIKHCINSRKISEYFGKELGIPSLCNIWIPDGYKDTPANRLAPRERLLDSLNQIYSVKLDDKYILDCVESKVFGIGAESYTVGSHEFYLGYALKNNVLCLLDNGHFHPTENIADKLSSLLLYSDKIALHLTRGVRWDSDHVISFNDEIKDICKEIISLDALDKTLIGIDYFDASINRIAAWVIGVRNVYKALLLGLLTPHKYLSKLQDEGNFTKVLAIQEEIKSYPFTDIWDEFCLQNNIPIRDKWLECVENYEKDILSKR